MKSKGTILNFAVDVGVELLNCGAEIQRVEETMTRILSAYGCNDAEVSATPVNIIATVSDNSLPLTKSARIKYRDTNLYRLEQLNALSRRICETKPDILMARKQLAKIKEEKGSGVFGCGTFVCYILRWNGRGYSHGSCRRRYDKNTSLSA